MKKKYILILCNIINPLISHALSERDTFKKLEQIEQHLAKLTQIMEKQEQREQAREQAQKKAVLQRLQQQQQADLTIEQQSVKKTILLGLLQYTCLHVAPQIIAHIEAMLIRKLTEKTLGSLDRVTGDIIGSRIPLFEFRLGQWLTMPDDEREHQNSIRKFCQQDPAIKQLFDDLKKDQEITADDVRKALIRDINKLHRQRSTKTPQFFDVSDMSPEDLAYFVNLKNTTSAQAQPTATSASSTPSKDSNQPEVTVSPINSSDELNTLLGRNKPEGRRE